MTTPAIAILFLTTAGADLAQAQSPKEISPATSPVTAEADIAVGHSTADVNAAAAQIRLFGASKSDLRFFVEAVWSARTTSASDAFGAAYPYDNSVRPMEAYIEKMAHPAGRLFGVRLGRYRTPLWHLRPKRARVQRIPSRAADSVRHELGAVEHVPRSRCERRRRYAVAVGRGQCRIAARRGRVTAPPGR